MPEKLLSGFLQSVWLYDVFQTMRDTLLGEATKRKRDRFHWHRLFPLLSSLSPVFKAHTLSGGGAVTLRPEESNLNTNNGGSERRKGKLRLW